MAGWESCVGATWICSSATADRPRPGSTQGRRRPAALRRPRTQRWNPSPARTGAASRTRSSRCRPARRVGGRRPVRPAQPDAQHSQHGLGIGAVLGVLDLLYIGRQVLDGPVDGPKPLLAPADVVEVLGVRLHQVRRLERVDGVLVPLVRVGSPRHRLEQPQPIGLAVGLGRRRGGRRTEPRGQDGRAEVRCEVPTRHGLPRAVAPREDGGEQVADARGLDASAPAAARAPPSPAARRRGPPRRLPASREDATVAPAAAAPLHPLRGAVGGAPPAGGPPDCEESATWAGRSGAGARGHRSRP